MSLILRFLLVCSLGVTCACGAEQDRPTVNLPAPPMPMYGDHSGTVTLQVVFDSGGNVASCRVLKSSGSNELDGKTADFVKSHWHSMALAGQTAKVPISYVPRLLPYGTPVVPNLLLPGEPSVSLRLWVSFDADGYVKSFGAYQMSGHTQIDNRILKWIYLHWRTKNYQHQTVEVQLHFDALRPGVKPNTSDGSAK